MTEKQAEKKLRALLKMTIDRGTTQAEQENATRRIGEILQAFPKLRHIITEVEETHAKASSRPRAKASSRPRAQSHNAKTQSDPSAFWKGVMMGIAGTVTVAVGAAVLSTLLSENDDDTGA